MKKFTENIKAIMALVAFIGVVDVGYSYAGQVKNNTIAKMMER